MKKPNNPIRFKNLEIGKNYLLTDHEGYNREVQYIAEDDEAYMFKVLASEYNSTNNDIGSIQDETRFINDLDFPRIYSIQGNEPEYFKSYKYNV
jgi:hypothetical protein